MLVSPEETCLQQTDSDGLTQSLRPSSAALFCAPGTFPKTKSSLRSSLVHLFLGFSLCSILCYFIVTGSHSD